MNPLNALLDDIAGPADYGDARRASDILSHYTVPDDARTVASKLAAAGVGPGDVGVDGVHVTFAQRNHAQPVRSPAFASADAARGTACALRLLLVDRKENGVVSA